MHELYIRGCQEVFRTPFQEEFQLRVYRARQERKRIDDRTTRRRDEERREASTERHRGEWGVRQGVGTGELEMGSGPTSEWGPGSKNEGDGEGEGE